MVKLAAHVREELLKILRKDRKNARCELCRRLHGDGKELVSELDKQIVPLKEEIRELEETKEKILRDAKLLTFEVSYNQCPADVLHPYLIEFDKETDRLVTELLLK